MIIIIFIIFFIIILLLITNNNYIIILIISIFILYYIYYHKKPKLEAMKSNIDGKTYLVLNKKNKQIATDVLAIVMNNIILLTNHLYKNISKYKDYENYIIKLNDKINDINLEEGSNESSYTSYTINKGEQMIFCLRSKKSKDIIHDTNLIMYVALHEIAHIACPEYGHTELFKKIFAFFVQTSIDLGLYNKIDFNNNPTEYCGLTINASIV